MRGKLQAASTRATSHQQRAPHHNSISFHLHITASATHSLTLPLGYEVRLTAAKCEHVKVALKLCAGKWISRPRTSRKLVFTFRETQRGAYSVSM